MRISLKELLANCLFNNGTFCRIDIPIRVMAVEDYARFQKINNLWWRMQYAKLWYSWGKYGISPEDYEDTVFVQKRRLKDMVYAFDCGTFPNMPLTVGSNLALKDGSHRLSCHIYFEIESVPLEVLEHPYYKPEEEDRFIMELYTPDEVNKIIDYKNYIIGKYGL